MFAFTEQNNRLSYCNGSYHGVPGSPVELKVTDGSGKVVTSFRTSEGPIGLTAYLRNGCPGCLQRQVSLLWAGIRSTRFADAGSLKSTRSSDCKSNVFLSNKNGHMKSS